MFKSLVLIATLFASLTHAETYYVSERGSDDAKGGKTTPFKTIQRGVRDLNAGDVLEIRGGIYAESVKIARSGRTSLTSADREKNSITIRAAPGEEVWITGKESLGPPQQRADGTLVFPWDHPFEIGRDGKNQPIRTHPADDFHRTIGRPEQVWELSDLLVQRLKGDPLGPGEFYVDDAAKQLIIRPRQVYNPTHSYFWASVRSTWIETQSASYITLEGLHFRNAANFAQRGALQIGTPWNTSVPAPAGWLVEDCTIELANAVGVSLTGEDHVIYRSTIVDNGQLGLSASRTTNLTINKTRIDHNNTKGFDTGWEAGGAKITLSSKTRVINSGFLGNRGSGLWFDIGCENAQVDYNYIADNLDAGLFFEISDGLSAIDNVFQRNARNPDPASWGMAGVTLSNSRNCSISFNDFEDNRDSIAWREQARTTPRIANPDGVEEAITTSGHAIEGNRFGPADRFALALWWDVSLFDTRPALPLAPAHLQFERNAYLPRSGKFLLGATWKPGSQTFADEATLRNAAGISDGSKAR